MKKDHLRLPVSRHISESPQYWINFINAQSFTKPKVQYKFLFKHIEKKLQRILSLQGAHCVGLSKNIGIEKKKPYLKFRTERDKMMFILRWS